MNKERTLVKQTTIDVAKETSKRFKGINTSDIKMIIDETFEVMKEMLLSGDYIVIQNLGVFFTEYLDEVDIKDPRNDDIIHFPKNSLLVYNGCKILEFVSNIPKLE